MKKATTLTFILVGLLCVANQSRALAQQFSVETASPVTLYSEIKYRGEQRKICLSLLTGVSYSNSQSAGNPCDLYYGMLYAGNEKDWLQSSAAQGQRSVIKDLGKLDWTASFKIPVVVPLPELKPGERRHYSVNTSGADGADGADGAPGRAGARGADGAGVDRALIHRPDYAAEAHVESDKPKRPKHDGKPEVSSLWVKAVAGHMYVIHVVDDDSDYYALFRVEVLESGDNVTISWKLIPAPEAETARRK